MAEEYAGVILVEINTTNVAEVATRVCGIVGSKECVRIIGGRYNIVIWSDWMPLDELMGLVETIKDSHKSVAKTEVLMSIRRVPYLFQ